MLQNTASSILVHWLIRLCADEFDYRIFRNSGTCRPGLRVRGPKPKPGPSFCGASTYRRGRKFCVFNRWRQKFVDFQPKIFELFSRRRQNLLYFQPLSFTGLCWQPGALDLKVQKVHPISWTWAYMKLLYSLPWIISGW
jgi:hypothetical protein